MPSPSPKVASPPLPCKGATSTGPEKARSQETHISVRHDVGGLCLRQPRHSSSLHGVNLDLTARRQSGRGHACFVCHERYKTSLATANCQQQQQITAPRREGFIRAKGTAIARCILQVLGKRKVSLLRRSLLAVPLPSLLLIGWQSVNEKGVSQVPTRQPEQYPCDLY